MNAETETTTAIHCEELAVGVLYPKPSVIQGHPHFQHGSPMFMHFARTNRGVLDGELLALFFCVICEICVGLWISG